MLRIDGNAAQGAIVLLCRQATDYIGCNDQIGETVTDTDGRYSFRDIPPGDYLPAIRISQQSAFVFGKQTVGKTIPANLKYSVAPNETLVIPDFQLDRELEKLEEPPVKLISPVASVSIGDSQPTLRWEPVAGAQYGVLLTRVDKTESDIQLTDHPYELIAANSIAVRKDLEDGLYKWTVYVDISNDKESTRGNKMATAYFTIAKAPAANH